MDKSVHMSSVHPPGQDTLEKFWKEPAFTPLPAHNPHKAPAAARIGRNPLSPRLIAGGAGPGGNLDLLRLDPPGLAWTEATQSIPRERIG